MPELLVIPACAYVTLKVIAIQQHPTNKHWLSWRLDTCYSVMLRHLRVLEELEYIFVDRQPRRFSEQLISITELGKRALKGYDQDILD